MYPTNNCLTMNTRVTRCLIKTSHHKHPLSKASLQSNALQQTYTQQIKLCAYTTTQVNNTVIKSHTISKTIALKFTHNITLE
eukprot:gene2633-1631_t